MIKTQELTPEVYYKKSRDFQLLGRIYDIIFNYLKTSVDTIGNLPLSKNSDKKLLDLLVTTLGFKSKHNYNNNQLYAICSMFMKALRNKGNIKSIELAINTLLQVEGIEEKCLIVMDYDTNTLKIYIPQKLVDITLFNDLLNYILPAGISCSIIRQQLLTGLSTTKLASSDDILFAESKASASSSIVPGYQDSVELSDVNGEFEGRIDNTVVVPYQEYFTISLITEGYKIEGDSYIARTSSESLISASVIISEITSESGDIIHPTTVSVTGCSFKYNSTTGLLNLFDATTNVEISVTA